MQKIQFEDYPDTTTPISADNLNQVQINVENAINSVDNEIPGVLNEEISSLTDCYCTTYINNQINELDNKINDLQYCIATISSSQTITSNYIIDLNTISRKEGNFTLSNRGIRIGAGINTIRVSGSIFVENWSGGNNYIFGKIIKKDGDWLTTSINASSAEYVSTSMASTIVEVNEGDIIQLIADSGAGGTLRYGAENTFLCIEKIN